MCSAGNISPELAATTDQMCTPCVEGSYAPYDGMYECIPCPAGKYCPMRAIAPLAARATLAAHGASAASSLQPANFVRQAAPISVYYSIASMFLLLMFATWLVIWF